MKYITFDTSWLERMNYDFSFAAFRCIQFTDYTVIISEVVDQEIKKHIANKAKEFVNSFNGSFKKARFLLNARKLPEELKENTILKAAEESYSIFKNTIRAIIVPLEKCDLNEIFGQYFSGEGPFSQSGKKSEFPDAVAINSINKYIGENEIVVFSCDDDWKNGFQNNKNASVYGEILDLIKIIKTEDLAGEIIDDYIDNKVKDFVQHINDSFEEYFSNIHILFPDDYSVEYLDIDDFDLNFIDYTAIEVISKNDEEKKILAAVHFKYNFYLKISFDDNSCSTYDREDDITYNIIRRRQRISGSETGYCFVEFEFKSDKFEKIINCNFQDVDFCYKDSQDYDIECEPIEENDYYNS